MKKIIIPVIAIGLFAVSCKKDYSCTCTTIYTTTVSEPGEADEVSTNTNSDTYKVNEAKPHQAQAACNEATVTTENSYDVGQSTYTNKNETTCVLTK